MKSAVVGLSLFASLVCAQAKIVTKTVPYDQGGVHLIGYLAYDDAQTGGKKLPGVLVVPEWWGLNDFVKGRAEALAKLGYIAFAADMYGDGQSTTDPEKAKELSSALYGKPLMAERAQAGLDQLTASGPVDQSNLAAIGFCFGGATCQVLAYSGAPLKAIVSFHGALVPLPADAAGKTHAKFLVLQGELDPFVTQDQRTAFIKSLDDGKIDFQFLTYSGAVHAFMNPEADKFRAAGLEGLGYDAAVAQRAWNQMQLFFQEIFGTGKTS
jgi:dienelactone hydrolase